VINDFKIELLDFPRLHSRVGSELNELLQFFPSHLSETLPVLSVLIHAIPAIREMSLLLNLEYVLIALTAVEQGIFW
jgi:hypothetical protein